MKETTPQISTIWTPEQLNYMSILADPTETRTDEEIAKAVGVDRKTLWNWKQIDGFCDEAYNILKKNLSGKLGKVFGGLLKRAEHGDTNASRLILEAIGKLKVQGTKEGDKTINMYQLTTEDKEQWAIKYLEGMGYKVERN